MRRITRIKREVEMGVEVIMVTVRVTTATKSGSI